MQDVTISAELNEYFELFHESNRKYFIAVII